MWPPAPGKTPPPPGPPPPPRSVAGPDPCRCIDRACGGSCAGRSCHQRGRLTTTHAERRHSEPPLVPGPRSLPHDRQDERAAEKPDEPHDSDRRELRAGQRFSNERLELTADEPHDSDWREL